MTDIIVGNVCSLCAMVSDSISGTRKKNSQILGIQILSQVFYGVGSVVLKGYSGTVQNVVTILRNLAAMKGIKSRWIEWTLIVLGVALGIAFNNRGLLGWLPIAANLEYSIAVFYFKKSEKGLKIAFILNMLIFTVFSFAISNYVGILSNTVAAVTTLVSLLRKKKDPQKSSAEEAGKAAHRAVQKIAKDAMAYVEETIRPGMSLAEVRRLAEEKMIALGADSFWYWDVGAFVFAGEETGLSLSGREYRTSDRRIGNDDLVTIDLSPQKAGVWGDYARTLIVENGRAANDISSVKNAEWRNGLLTERKLHQGLLEIAVPDMTFEELYEEMNRYIRECGFVNLDHHGNLGHSLASERDGRVFIETGSREKLSSVGYFTFEPHIGLPGSPFGYKREDVYFFEDGRLKEL